MKRARAFLGLGSNVGDPPAQIEAALAALEARGHRVAAVARCVSGAYENPPDATSPSDVLNTVAEIRTVVEPRALLDDLLAIESEAGRVRDGGPNRTLDLDLLAYEDRTIDEDGLVVPHPRCTERVFVLVPWMDIAPLYEVGGVTVAAHLAPQRERVLTLERGDIPQLPHAGGAAEKLSDASALRTWRDAQKGSVGVVMTMGALHDGHATLVRRARAECDNVLATLFVNPLQFDDAKDLSAYPQTLEADLEVLRVNGADAVYVPRADDLYPDGFDEHITPGPPASGYEAEVRPGHFEGVVTVVKQLWQRTRPDRAYFGRKDAQQVAVIKSLVDTQRLHGDVIVCPTVRDRDGLALSSRNRRLSAEERELALSLHRALQVLALAGAHGAPTWKPGVVAACSDVLKSENIHVDYLDVVDPDTMRACDEVRKPALAIGAIRVGATRLIDNCWVVRPSTES